jgi:hypothetical protein
MIDGSFIIRVDELIARTFATSGKRRLDVTKFKKEVKNEASVTICILPNLAFTKKTSRMFLGRGRRCKSPESKEERSQTRDDRNDELEETEEEILLEPEIFGSKSSTGRTDASKSMKDCCDTGVALADSAILPELESELLEPDSELE